jgi:hypothetical protein
VNVSWAKIYTSWLVPQPVASETKTV